MPPSDHYVTLITRDGCHLCADASLTLTRLAAELGFGYVERDVDTDADLTPKDRFEYGDHVPVILIDGREHGYWRVEEPRFLFGVVAGRLCEWEFAGRRGVWAGVSASAWGGVLRKLARDVFDWSGAGVAGVLCTAWCGGVSGVGGGAREWRWAGSEDAAE